LLVVQVAAVLEPAVLPLAPVIPRSTPFNNASTLKSTSPIIIGHRGASGYCPEHTLASYELALALGADYIELDLVVTHDGVLIARHENEISGTTDIADHPEFTNRKTTKVIDGISVTGWFTEDFTLAEIKTLRAKERLPWRDQSFNGAFEIPTLQEAINLALQKSVETSRTIGIYLETKHPTYFDSIGLSLTEPLVQMLTNNGYTAVNAPVFIQSFETANLKDLRSKTDLPLIQLFGDWEAKPYDFVVNGDRRTYGDLTSPLELTEVATYTSGIGPDKRLIVPVSANGWLRTPTSLIDDAHAASLLVHAYTFRNEGCYLAPDYNGNPELEYEQFFNLGIDGMFSDFPNTAIAVRNNGLH